MEAAPSCQGGRLDRATEGKTSPAGRILVLAPSRPAAGAEGLAVTKRRACSGLAWLGDVDCKGSVAELRR
jgi:hypothetical protein